MHSTLVRIQNAFGFFTSVAFAVAAAIAVSVLLSPQTPSASLELKNVRVAKGRPYYYSQKREEYAHVTFSLDADLSTLFSWNTKQVFLYITATYPSRTPSTIPPSEVVIWDAIIPAANAPFHPNTWVHPLPKGTKPAKPTKPAKSAKGAKKPVPAGKAWPADAAPGIVRLPDQKPKYQITDASGLMAGRTNATLRLHWNVQPWVGALVWTNTRTWGRWAGRAGGASAAFAFPELKGGSETVKKEDMRTEKGGERNRGDPGATNF